MEAIRDLPRIIKEVLITAIKATMRVERIGTPAVEKCLQLRGGRGRWQRGSIALPQIGDFSLIEVAPRLAEKGMDLLIVKPGINHRQDEADVAAANINRAGSH